MDNNKTHCESFDRDWVLDQIGGDVPLLHEIISVFLVDGPEIRERLHNEIPAANPEAVRATAHYAKSAVGNFGAMQATQAALALENAAKYGNTEQFATLAHELDMALLELESILRQEIT